MSTSPDLDEIAALAGQVYKVAPGAAKEWLRPIVQRKVERRQWPRYFRKALREVLADKDVRLSAPLRLQVNEWAAMNGLDVRDTGRMPVKRLDVPLTREEAALVGGVADRLGVSQAEVLRRGVMLCIERGII